MPGGSPRLPTRLLDPSLGCSGPFKTCVRSEAEARCPPRKSAATRVGRPRSCAPAESHARGSPPHRNRAVCARPLLSLWSPLAFFLQSPGLLPAGVARCAQRGGVDVRKPLASGVRFQIQRSPPSRSSESDLEDGRQDRAGGGTPGRRGVSKASGRAGAAASWRSESGGHGCKP